MNIRNLADTTVVESFVSYLKINGYPNLKIDSIPDKENVKGDKDQDIDAIAGPFAVEHTSIDTVRNQSRDSARFLKVVADLETEISPQLNYYLEILLPYEGIHHGQNWSLISESLKGWILNFSNKLPDGRHSIDRIPNIPFQFNADKASDLRPGLIFIRPSPDNNDFSNRLRTQINRKAKKLKPYKEKNFRTILLIESDDIALMNKSIMLNGIRVAFSQKLPDGVDEIWYADTSVPENILFHNFTDSICAKTI